LCEATFGTGRGSCRTTWSKILVPFFGGSGTIFVELEHVQGENTVPKGAAMLVKLPDESPDFVEKLKEQTGATTAAGAYRFAAERYGSLTYQLKQAMDELARLQTRCNVQQQIIDNARASASSLLDHVAQGDLLQS
ncbi:hypothetical protein ACVN04_11075, partial [Pseudomonas aeruginosa]